MIRAFIVFILLSLMMFMPSCNASLWHKDSKLGNEIKKEEYPDSKDVEPKKSQENDNLVIQGGIETGIDITLEEC